MAEIATLERPQVAEFAAQKPSNIVRVPPQQETKAYPPKLAKALMAITREFGAIKKDGWNDFHKYHYQKWEDILERESVLLVQHGIILQQSEVARSLLDKLISITYEFTIINDDGDAWPDRPVFTAIARLQDNKGVFDDKAANKCHSQAHKYFLLHTFKVKTKDVQEADADAQDGGDEVPPKQVAKPPRPGSEEAKALEGPRLVAGADAKGWTDNFIACIETAASAAEIDEWAKINAQRLELLKKYPDEHARAHKAISERRATFTPKPPKPPRPNIEAAKPATTQMPDPVAAPTEFITWLDLKFQTFQSHAEGETYWYETVEALDLPGDVQEAAMGVWRHFELRFEQ